MGEHDPHVEDHNLDHEAIEELRWKEVEELAREHQERADHLAHEAKEAIARITEDLADFVDYKLDVDALDAISSGEQESAYLEFSDGAGNDAYDRLLAGTRALIDGLSPGERALSRARFLADFFGFHSGTAADRARISETTLTLLCHSLDHPGVPLNAKDGVLELITRWRKMDPASLWAELASRHRESFMDQASIADAVITMSFVAELSPPDEPFTWDSKAQFANYVRRMIDRQIPGFPVDAARMYNAAAELLQELPAAAVAQVVREALGALVADPRPPDPGPEAVAAENIRMLGSSVARHFEYMSEATKKELTKVNLGLAADSAVTKQHYFESRFDLSDVWSSRLATLDPRVSKVLASLASNHDLSALLQKWGVARRSGKGDAAVAAGRELSKSLYDIRSELESMREALGGVANLTEHPEYLGSLKELDLLAAEVAREMCEWQGASTTPQEIGDLLGECRSRARAASRIAAIEVGPLLRRKKGKSAGSPLEAMLEDKQSFIKADQFSDPVRALEEALLRKSIGDHAGETGVTSASQALLDLITSRRPDASKLTAEKVLAINDFLDRLSFVAGRRLDSAATVLGKKDGRRVAEYARLAAEFRAVVGVGYPPANDPASYWNSRKAEILKTIGSGTAPKFDRDLGRALAQWMEESAKMPHHDVERLKRSTGEVVAAIVEHRSKIEAAPISSVTKASFELLFESILTTLRERLGAPG